MLATDFVHIFFARMIKIRTFASWLTKVFGLDKNEVILVVLRPIWSIICIKDVLLQNTLTEFWTNSLFPENSSGYNFITCCSRRCCNM